MVQLIHDKLNMSLNNFVNNIKTKVITQDNKDLLIYELAQLLKWYETHTIELLDELEDIDYTDKLINYFSDTAFVCTRVQEAWTVGTMSQDDFRLMSEDIDYIEDLNETLLKC